MTATISNGARIKSGKIKTFKDFTKLIQDGKGNQHFGFVHSSPENFSSKNKNLSSLAVAAQIGGSGIQVGITGLKANNEVSIFELPQFKKANGKTSPEQEIQDAKDNFENFKVLAQIIEFVGEYAKRFGQENFYVDIGVAGFDAHNPPENVSEELKAKAREGKDGEYYMANVPFDSGDGRGPVNFFNPSMLFTEKLRNMTTGFSFRSERGTIVSPFKVHGSILNDTVTLACSHTEGLNTGDSSVGVVCGTGFNMGIARKFNGVGFDDLTNANLELGHWAVAPDAKYLSPFDIPFVQDGKLLSQEERNELVKTKSPEVLFSGSSAEARSIKNILINIRDFIEYFKANQKEFIDGNDKLNPETSEAIKTLISLTSEIDPEEFTTRMDTYIKDIQTFTNKNIEDLNDIDILKYASSQDTENNFLVQFFYEDYFKRLGILIGETLKAQGVDNPKAINFTGSYFVESMKTLAKADQYFREGLALGLDKGLRNVLLGEDTETGIKINLTSREEMDGMATMIKTKANAESKRRIETLAAQHRAAVSA